MGLAMKAIASAFSIFGWIFFRLPLAFSIVFTALSLFWMFYGFKYLKDLLTLPLETAATSFLKSELPSFIANPLIGNLNELFWALLVIILFSLGLLISYNLAALVNWIVITLKLKPIPYPVGIPQIPAPGSSVNNKFNEAKIGIVFAGGGAKGAFQAGAMRAIYHYLDECNALEKVKVISGTSIGSWNGLFWLADLIKPETGWQGQSVHEGWWRNISAKSLTAPSWYMPFCRNAFLSSKPWQQVFDHIFGRDDVKKRIFESDIHFYFTRSNVRSGQLQCATNNENPPKIARVSFDKLDSKGGQDAFLTGLKNGIFASMDIPPLFPFMECNDNLFEDGGVIDNLPIIFPAMEGCNLLFVLPLNSDFEEEPNETSVMARLFRVMDVRQGALERNSFKIQYLYNELAVLRRCIDELAATACQKPFSALLSYALARKHEQISIFAVCPQKSFVQSTINTQEFWKQKEAGIAFNIMYQATAEMLANFEFNKHQDKVRVALISRSGNATWDEDF
jgi:predicted acylesterase/phospholipase RssA